MVQYNHSRSKKKIRPMTLNDIENVFQGDMMVQLLA